MNVRYCGPIHETLDFIITCDIRYNLERDGDQEAEQ